MISLFESGGAMRSPLFRHSFVPAQCGDFILDRRSELYTFVIRDLLDDFIKKMDEFINLTTAYRSFCILNCEKVAAYGNTRAVKTLSLSCLALAGASYYGLNEGKYST